MTDTAEAPATPTKPPLPRGLAIAALAGQIALFFLLCAGRTRIAFLVGAHGTLSRHTPLIAALDVAVTWAALAVAFWLLARRDLGFIRALVIAGTARAAIIPVALLAAPGLLQKRLADIPIHLDKMPPILPAEIPPSTWTLFALYAVAVIFAIWFHGFTWQKLTSRPAGAAFLLAFTLAAIVSQLILAALT